MIWICHVPAVAVSSDLFGGGFGVLDLADVESWCVDLGSVIMVV